jgi:hypothetical protein
MRYNKDHQLNRDTDQKLPEWKVYYKGSFWGHHGRERAGKEMAIRKQFSWGEKNVYIPAVYACSKGLVVDYCIQIPREYIQAFMNKWNLTIENDGSDFTHEQRLKIDDENPLSMNMRSEVVLNGKVLTRSNGCGLSWNPCFPELNGIESKGVLEHYGLDASFGWVIWRYAFPWATKNMPLITTLDVTLKQGLVAIYGPHFHVSAPSDCIEFSHPTTGVQHTLTVQEYQRQEMSTEHFGDKNYEYPTHYTVMNYTLTPHLSANNFTVTDCEESDRPQKKQIISNVSLSSTSCAAIAIIGGSNGPTAIVLGSADQGNLGTTCSALHFEPVDEVEWQMVFHEKTCEDITVKLL